MILLRLTIACAILIGTVGAPIAVEQAEPSAQAPAKPGTIRGRVTSAQNGKPLRRARITLISTNESGTLTTGLSAGRTNSQGVFEIADVPPGSYYVSASAAGLLTVQYGQRRPGERGAVVEVTSGRTVQKIDIALPRGGVLAGRITDELGEPYPGVRVMAFDLRYRLGRRVPAGAGSATTDDLGQYRIPSLQPGDYYVSAMSSEMWQNEKKETLGYATTFYPGTGLDLAQTIPLGPSQERLDLDFTVALSHTARVTGRVQRPSGEVLAGEPVNMALTIRGLGAILAGMNSLSARTAGDGTFEFRNVPPADYLIRAGSRGDYASVTLSVIGDVKDVLLIPRTGSTVSGHVITDEGVPPQFPASGVRVLLIAPEDDRVLPTVRVPAVNNDWSFRLQNLGGPFVFRLRGLPDDWMLDAIKLKEDDLADVPFDVPTGGREITGMQIVLTKKIGTIAGTVVDFAGNPEQDATVVVFADESDRWMPGSRFVRSIRPDAGGHFSITGLPAATYRAIAKELVAEGQWEDRAFLDAMKKEATTLIELGAGASASVTLKLPPRR